MVANQKIIPYVDYCTCGKVTYWLVGLCSFKVLLLIFGMFLAWETRKVSMLIAKENRQRETGRRKNRQYISRDRKSGKKTDR